MKVLIFTTLYPNNVSPTHGVFVKERMAKFAKLNACEVKVVAPVPYFPAVKLNWRWRFSQVVSGPASLVKRLTTNRVRLSGR